MKKSLLLFSIISFLFNINVQSQWSTSYTNNQLFECFFVNENTGWVSGDSCKVYKTSNCGNSWNLIYSPPTTNIIYCMYFIDTSKGWAGTFTGDVLKTTDGGHNWLTYSAIYNKRIFDVFFVNENTGFYIGGEGAYGKTTNGGITWVNQILLGSNNGYSVYFLNSQTGFACGIYNLARTTNGGNNWDVTYYPQGYLYTINFINSNTGWVLGGNIINGNAIGLYALKTSNGGINWDAICSEPAATGYFTTVKDVYFINEYVGYLVGTSGYMPPPGGSYGIMKKTTNGGINWSNVSLESANNIEAITFVNQQTGFAAGCAGFVSNYGIIYKTTNGGVTPIFSVSGTVKYSDNNQPVTSGTVKAFKLNKTDGSVIYVDSAQIQSNGTYALNNVPQDSLDIGVFPNSTPPNDWVITYYPSTTDWQHATVVYPTGNLTNINISAIRLQSTTASNSVNGKVMRLTDVVTGNLKDAFLYAKNGTSFVRCAITDVNGIYHLQSLPAGSLEIIVNRLGFTGDSVNVNVTTTSNIDSVNFHLYRLYTGIKQIVNETPTEYILYQNYPNPFNPITKIKFSIPPFEGGHGGMTVLKVYNILGKEITTLVNQFQSPGTYEVSWDASDFPSGIYFYKLTTDKFTDVKRMILIK